MSKCSICGKKLGIFEGYGIDDKDFCSDCYKNKKEEIEKLKIKAEEDNRKEVEKEKNQVKEYKRKCNQCGKIWHSLVKNEKYAIGQGLLNSLVGVGTALTGDMGASTQSNRNANAQLEQIDNLRKCPNCGSADYIEEIIAYKKK